MVRHATIDRLISGVDAEVRQGAGMWRMRRTRRERGRAPIDASWPAWPAAPPRARGRSPSHSRWRVPPPPLSLSTSPSHINAPSLTSAPYQTFFALACGSDTYAACHGGDHPGGMLDVRVGDWTPIGGGGGDAGSAAAVKKALAAASAGLAAAAPKKGWAARKAAAKKGGGGGGDAEVGSTTAPPLADPAAPAVRALAYRMPPDWGEGWLTKRELREREREERCGRGRAARARSPSRFRALSNPLLLTFSLSHFFSLSLSLSPSRARHEHRGGPRPPAGACRG